MSTNATSSNTRSITVRSLDVAVTVSAIVFWAIVLYWARTQAMSRVQYGVIFLGGIMSVYALNEAKEAIEKGRYIDSAVLLPSTIVLISAAIYFASNFQQVYVIQQGYATEHQYMIARLVVLSLLYLTWREFGNLFLGLIGGGILYGFFGNYAPGIAHHAGINELQMLQLLVTDLYGFYGSLTQLTAAWIAPFLLYAGLLFAFGGFQLILRIAIVVSRYVESGVAQTGVLASAVIGSINGSYTANAAMTGSFTIPTMIDAGMARHRAAAVEAVASTSGQALPPVMGASAFVMASYLGVRYVDIIIAGLMPAVIFVVTIVIAVHYMAVKDLKEKTMEFSEFFDVMLTQREKIYEGLRFGIPFFVLIYLLGVVQYTVMTSALYTIVAMVITGIGFPVVTAGMGYSETGIIGEFLAQVRNTVEGFRRGAIILAPIAIILASINGVIDIFNGTGVPNKISLFLMALSGGVLIVAVLLAMVVSILLGVGMPTVAAYVIVAILIAPTLISQFGVEPIVAHYTVFYAAILAGITPPVATAAVVAAGIAEANFWRTCGEAIKIAAPLFVLPVAFVFNANLVSMTANIDTVAIGTLVLLGGIAMIYGINYPFEFNLLARTGLRLGLVAVGLVVMVYPNVPVKIGGILAFAGVFLAEKIVSQGWKNPLSRRVEQ